MTVEALLHPGHLELHIEISLFRENGQFQIQILNVHTSKMRTNRAMDDYVDFGARTTDE